MSTAVLSGLKIDVEGEDIQGEDNETTEDGEGGGEENPEEAGESVLNSSQKIEGSQLVSKQQLDNLQAQLSKEKEARKHLEKELS
jgi:hypothetical protein